MGWVIHGRLLLPNLHRTGDIDCLAAGLALPVLLLKSCPNAHGLCNICQGDVSKFVMARYLMSHSNKSILLKEPY